MADTAKDEVLLQSGICERVWDLYSMDPPQFMKEVKDYFTLCYPGWTVVRASHKERKIYLRDDR